MALRAKLMVSILAVGFISMLIGSISNLMATGSTGSVFSTIAQHKWTYIGNTLGWMAILSLLGWWIANHIVNPLKKVVDFAVKLNHGDLSANLDMGTPINCASIKGCGLETCPSFNKVTHCWVEAGSFSTDPSCPSTLKGLDCRDYNVYKMSHPNELREMGAALNAVVDGLKVKARIAREIANGNLDQRVHITTDEDTLGRSLQDMTHSLNDVISNVSRSADQVKTGSDQIAIAGSTLAQGASEQAASLEEISSSLTEVDGKSQTTSKNAADASKSVNSARDTAGKGHAQMQEMVVAMTTINESSHEISNIIKVIDEIAFQTNLLALNAAVEAARAGKHGKGFAVVAEEVRNLAARSSKAASETSVLIESSTKNVENGTVIADQTAGALDQIVSEVDKVTELVDEIASASQEQSEGLAQISIGIEQIDKVTQHNAASTEETASSAQELATHASLLQDALLRFTTKNYSAADGNTTSSENGQDEYAGGSNEQYAEQEAQQQVPV